MNYNKSKDAIKIAPEDRKDRANKAKYSIIEQFAA